VFTTVVAALTLIGVAWAGTDRGAEAEAEAEIAAQASVATGDTIRADGSTGVTGGSSSSAVTNASSSTGVTGGSSSTTVTSPGSGSTSSTIDDNDDIELIVSAGGTFAVPGVGTVTIELSQGRLVLKDVSAPGWGIDVKDLEPDEIRVEFRKGDAEARFEAELDDGILELEIKTD
jgi:hypothetical protein